MSDVPDPHEIVELDPSKVHIPPGNRLVTPELVADILPSIENDSQLVPAIVYPHPTLPGEWMAADGNRRAMVARILGRKLKAFVLAAAPTDEELIRIRVTTNFLRKNSSAYELAVDLERWMNAKNASQRQAAEFFRISEAQVSKILNKARNAIPEVIQAEKEGKIVEDVGRLLATLPKDKQAEALIHVLQNDMRRDSVEGFVANIKGFKRPKESKPVTASEGGATFRFPSSWSWQRIIESALKLVEAAKRGMKVDGLGTNALPGLLKT
jgi:ParB/RepB/Spo0J family partition protein